MRYVISAFAVTFWLVLGYVFYNSSKECCGNVVESSTTSATVIPESLEKKYGPLVFNWSDMSPVTNDLWAGYRDSILNRLGDNQLLEITGYYRADEINDTEYENLGIARAEEVSKLFMPPLTAEKIRKDGKLVNDNAGMSEPFASARMALRMNTEKIKEIDDRTLIYFPFNSTRKLDDTEVEAYLDDVVERLSKTEERVQLTGHTDNIGDAAANERLGKWRAEVIRDYLARQGLAEQRIITISRGETQPIADNETDSGRAQNRRTELQIVK